jgi:hypothetical protein
VENAAWDSKQAPNHSSANESSSWAAGAANQKSPWAASAANKKSSWGLAEANENVSAAAVNEKSSWGAATSSNKAVDDVGGREKGEDAWNKATMKTGSWGSSSNSWGKATATVAGSPKVSGDNLAKGDLKIGTPADSSNDAAATWENKTTSDNQGGWRTSEEPWNKGKSVGVNPTSSWGDATAGKNQLDSWGKGKNVVDAGSCEKNKS